MKAYKPPEPIKRVSPERRMIEIICGEGVVASLAYYTGSLQQSLHSHSFSQVSFLLAGALLERLEGTEHELHTAAVGYKAAGSQHEDHWGKEGALIFSLKLLPNALPNTAPQGWVLHDEARTISALVRACLLAPTVAARGEVIADLLAMICAPAEGLYAQAPRWIEAVRCQINDAPDVIAVDALASGAGVDRAHLSRIFRHCYGVPPSVYRRRVLAARAVQALSLPHQGLSMVAAQAGFSDQAHMNRTFQNQIGMTPGQLMRILNG